MYPSLQRRTDNAHQPGLSSARETRGNCIRTCEECVSACSDVVALCYRADEDGSLARPQAAAIECAAFCKMAVALLTRETEHASTFCTLCASVCDACARQCELEDDSTFVRCAKLCRLCAAECRSMVAAPFVMH